jgi:hypothetical protein
VKLEEIMLTEDKKKSNGTYVGVRFSKKTNDAIKKFIEYNDIPNMDSIEDNGGIHTTLIFSRKVLKDFKPKGKVNIKAKAKGFKKIGEKGKALVMELNSPELVKRHKEIRRKYGATHDWDEYIPHITLSTKHEDFDEKTLPKFTAPIEVVKEYTEFLELDDD